MSESIVSQTRPNDITDIDFLWKMYQNTHPLADTPTRELINFIIDNSKGQCAVVDSYYETIDSLVNVVGVYELQLYTALWSKDSRVQLIRTIHDSLSTSYDTIIAVGIHSFKYMTLAEYVDTVKHLFNYVRPNGNLIVCLPKLHFQYHRLKYNPYDIVSEVNNLINGHIVKTLETKQNFYLNIIHG